MSTVSISKEHINIFFVEHAKPAYPEGKKVLLGTLDTPLDKEGEEEARQLKAALERSGLVFDRILSSGLQRAHQTAAILAGDGSAIERNPAFNETYKGDLEGLTREEYTKKESYLTYKSVVDPKESFFTPLGAGGESKVDVALKLLPFINEMRSNPNLKGKTVVVVTHGTPLKVLHTLSTHPKSLEARSEGDLRSILNVIHPLNDPKSCDVVYYRVDETSFEYKGKLEFISGEGVKLNPTPPATK